MNFALYLSKRLRLTATEKKANTTGVVIAVAGVALAIMVMEITLGVVAGFKKGVTDKLMGFEGQVVVQAAYDYSSGEQERSLSFEPELRKALAEEAPGASVSLRYRMPGLLKTDTDFAGVYFTAHDTAHDFLFEKSCMAEGEFPDYSDSGSIMDIVLSKATAQSLGINPGEKVNVCFFADEAVRMRRFRVAGTYESGFSEYDNTVAFASLEALQGLGDGDSLAGTEIELSGISLDEAAPLAERLQQRLLDDYRDGRTAKLYPVDNITHTGAGYLNWLALLDTNVAVIFVLMLCVAALTLVSSMFILILERIPTIGILRAMGATRSQIRSTFIFMAMKVVGMGLVIGNVLGLGLLALQKAFLIVPLDPGMYFLKYVPVDISVWAVLGLNIGAAAAAWLILILPSGMAAKVSPAVSMRFD